MRVLNIIFFAQALTDGLFG